jgi:hypothetical protein
MMGRRAIVGAVVAGWLAVAGSPEALAQQATKPGAASSADPQVELARMLYKDGVKEASRGHWQKAQALFAEAFKLRPHFQIAFNLGQAELKLGDYVPAAEHLAFFLRDAQGVGDEERRQAREMLDAAERQVTTLVISTEQRGVEVLVDGVSVGETPLGREVFVAPGRRVIQARREGYEPVTEVRTVDAGAYVELKLSLRKVGQVAAPVAVPQAAPAPEAPAQGGANKGIVIGGATVSVVGVGLGVASIFAWRSREGMDGSCSGACTAFKNTAFWSLLGGGLLGGATAIYVLATPSAKTNSAVTARLVAGPTGGGIELSSRW